MTIPYGRQVISDQDLKAVRDVLKSDYLTQGPVVPAFEKAVSKEVSASFGVAVNSATSALHIACLAIDLGPGDILWTSPNSFIASANCALYCGANVDFVDIDSETYNLCPLKLEEKLAAAAAENRLPKIVMPVHMAGHSCDMERIAALGKKFGFKIIEDASHAIGASYAGMSVGCCAYSDITVFSFHPVKIITTAEGGMAMTNSPELAKRMRIFRTHGVTRDKADMEKTDEGEWFYEQHELGLNYRMTELQAALGLSQLGQLQSFVSKRQHLRHLYNKSNLRLLELNLPTDIARSTSSNHLFIIQLHLEKLSRSRKEIFQALRGRGIGVNVHYIPIYFQPYYQKLGFSRGLCPVAETYYERALSIPLSHAMSEEDLRRVVSIMSEEVV